VVEFLSIVARDISASKAADHAMRQSEERFRALSTAAPIGIFLADAAGLSTYYNSRWSAISGLSLQASLGFGWVDALHPEDRTETISAWLQAVADGGEWTHEHRIALPDGTVRWVRTMASPIRVMDGVTGFAGTVEDITARQEADERLRESNQRLRALTAYSQQVLEEEQTRIAREIHDQLGQSLTALKMDTAWLARRFKGTPRDQEVDRLQQMGELIDSTVQTVRRISTGLRPAVLDEFGLSAAIEWALGDFQKRTGITCGLHDEAPRDKLADGTSTAVFRILQEGLTNVARHAAASSVLVHLGLDHGWFVMTLQDNGRGMPDGTGPGSSLGILGMHERAALVGGNVEVESAPGRGTRLRVSVPQPHSRQS
jgi:PAS domain S-box-containing protein